MVAMAGPVAVDAIHCNSRATFCSFLTVVLYSGYSQRVMDLYAPQEWAVATSSVAALPTAIFALALARLASQN